MREDGELSDEELEQVVGGSKDIKILVENWRVYLTEQQRELNPALWDGDRLKPEVREQLLKIAQEFIDKTEARNVKIKDIIITGSLANYNYSEYSDIDLHIIINFEEVDDNYDLVKDYFDATKALWNYRHDILIKGHEVEIYVQDEKEEHHSTGVYSLSNDEWVDKPVYKEAVVDEELVAKKTDSLVDQIERALRIMDEDKHEEALERGNMLTTKIKKMRKAGLESKGEYSVENIVFKELRKSGSLAKLAELKREAYDAMMSLDEAEPSKGKRFAKTVKGKSGRTRTVSYGQAGKAKDGGDRIRPGTAKGDAYCARSAKIKKCKNPPCANDLSRKKWKCRGSKSVAEHFSLTESQLYQVVRKELLKELSLTGIDVPRIISLKRPVKKRSKAKDQIQRIETDLHTTQDAVDRLEEYTREIYNMLIKIIRKNK